MYVQDNDRPDTILDSAISLSGVAKSFAVPPTEPRWFSGLEDTISATSVYLQHSLAEWTRINGFYWKLGPSQARSGPSSTLDRFAWASRAHIFLSVLPTDRRNDKGNIKKFCHNPSGAGTRLKPRWTAVTAI